MNKKLSKIIISDIVNLIPDFILWKLDYVYNWNLYIKIQYYENEFYLFVVTDEIIFERKGDLFYVIEELNSYLW